MIDPSLFAQINEQAEKQAENNKPPEVEQIKNTNILLDNQETMKKIEKERTLITSESQNGPSYNLSDRVRRAKEKNDAQSSSSYTSSSSSSSNSNTSTSTKYTYGGGYNQNYNVNTEAEKNKKANEFAKKKVDQASKIVKKEHEEKSNSWDIFDLQNKKNLAAERMLTMTEKDIKKEEKKIRLLKGAIGFGKDLIKEFYKY